MTANAALTIGAADPRARRAFTPQDKPFPVLSRVKVDMRRVILGVSMSFDARIARVNGDVDFLRTPREHPIGAFFASVDTAIMGRKTLDAGLRMTGGKLPKTAMRMYVMSRTKEPGERGGVIFVNEPPAALVAQIRRQGGTDIWLMGGGELAREFLRDDLVDEIYLGIAPVLLGEGIPLFPSGFPQREFALMENKTYSEGLVTLKYERKREREKPTQTKRTG